MYILISSFSQAPEVVSPHFSAHCEWLNKYNQQGIFIASGPKISHLGGGILVKSIDKAALKKIIAEDSYVQADVADYLIVEIDVKLAAKGFEGLLEA